MTDGGVGALSADEVARLRDRHPIHELVTYGRARLEQLLLDVHADRGCERTRLLIDSLFTAVEADQVHLADTPLAELVEDSDEALKWTALVYLATAGHRAAQIAVSARCAAEAYLMSALHDTVLGRQLDEGDRRLATRAMNDAERMVGHAVGWGVIANGARSKSRLASAPLTDHSKDLGLDLISALWTAVNARARDMGYQEGYAIGFDVGGLRAREAAGRDPEQAGAVTRVAPPSECVVVPQASLRREEKKEWGLDRIVGEPLLLKHAHGVGEVRRTLFDGHPHAAAAIERIVGDLADERPVAFRPTLLVGPPGAGKSRLCRDLLDALGVPFAPIDAGTTSDHGITGSPRRWSSSYPSLPLRLFAQYKVANPGVLVDELEKAGRSSAGSLHDPLLSLLEPVSSKKWRDHFLDAEIDASCLNWLFTANSTDGVPGALLNRLRVLRVPLPSAGHVSVLADRIRLDLVRERNLDPGMEPPLDGVELAAVVRAFGRQGSLRDLRRYVEALLDARASTARWN